MTAELHPGCWLERIMLDLIIVRGWLAAPWELQGPETERAVCIAHNLSDISDVE